MLLTLASGLTFTAASSWVHQLAFDGQAILSGELWRLATGHIAHLSWFHAAANALGFGIAVTVLAELTKVRTICAAVTLIATGIDTALLLPSFHSYVGFAGFSGILYGLATLILVLLIGKASAWATAIALTLSASLAISIFDWNPWGFATATETHIVGAILGGIFGFLLRRRAVST